jgi:hypothetical protein
MLMGLAHRFILLHGGEIPSTPGATNYRAFSVVDKKMGMFEYFLIESSYRLFFSYAYAYFSI